MIILLLYYEDNYYVYFLVHDRREGSNVLQGQKENIKKKENHTTLKIYVKRNEIVLARRNALKKWHFLHTYDFYVVIILNEVPGILLYQEYE